VHWGAVTALLGALLVVLSWAAVECHRYFRGRHVIGGKQLAWRMTIAVLIAVVVAMIMWGSFYRWTSAAHELLYWSVCLALMVLVILLTMKDWRMVLKEQHLRRAQLYQKMQDELGSLGDKRDEKGK
jgi:uncharacterized membrane protein YjgN (DUF898 family)